METTIRHDVSRFSEDVVYFFKEGTLYRAYDHFGSHVMTVDGLSGTYFAVWAPNAGSVSVIGDFNDWDANRYPLAPRWDSSGIWEGFIPNLKEGEIYKYHIRSNNKQYAVDKQDPYGFECEVPPRNASVVCDLSYEWNDEKWMKDRHEHNAFDAPMATYELHVGSWMRHADGNRYLSYRELADRLPKYIQEMGYTHVEFMPVMGHPFYGSWGYQVLGFFAAASPYGSPKDLMYLIDQLHQAGIGVILDWVPSHFPTDGHGLGYFDGTHLYEHEDPRKGFHPDWKSCIFNYGRAEVKDFLISSALFWLDKYHADGLRVDGVASMLYLDYSRKEGQWIPNEHGGRDNVEAIHFIKTMNETIYANFPDVQTIAEESTDWTGVSRPTFLGGLGFGLKWNMGWMHDTLKFFTKEAIHRKFHHNELTFSMLYAYTENFVLSLSHDEVVHGKASLLSKMPGDDWQKFANLRLLFSYMYAHPGKKLIYMGCEFGQRSEWYHEQSLDWHLLDFASHKGIHQLTKDLNHLYTKHAAFFERDFDPLGFEWVHCDDWENSILVFLRKSSFGVEDSILVACNFTPVPRYHYRVGVPLRGHWKELFNSDAPVYGGGGIGNMGGVEAEAVPYHGRPFSLELTLPPLGAVYFRLDHSK